MSSRRQASVVCCFATCPAHCQNRRSKAAAGASDAVSIKQGESGPTPLNGPLRASRRGPRAALTVSADGTHGLEVCSPGREYCPRKLQRAFCRVRQLTGGVDTHVSARIRALCARPGRYAVERCCHSDCGVYPARGQGCRTGGAPPSYANSRLFESCRKHCWHWLQ
jgi:hypothetical protein